MFVAGLVFLLFGYSLGIPTGEINTPAFGFNIEIYPKLLADPIGLNNLLIQWNKEGKTYLLSRNNALSYHEAKRTCEKYNMELVKIENEDQSGIIDALFEKYTRDGDGPFWMSGNRLTDEETWRWLNDDPINYFNWARREPNNAKGDEMCIELYRDFVAWNDERCSIPNPFVCENIPNADYGYNPILDSNDINGDIDEEITENRSMAPSSETPVPDFGGNPPLFPTDSVSYTDDDYEYDYDEEAHHSISDIVETKNETDVNNDKTTEEISEVTTDNIVSSTSRLIFSGGVIRPSYRKPPPPYIPPMDEEEDVAEYKESSDKERWSKPTLPAYVRFDDAESRPKETPSIGWSDRVHHYPPVNTRTYDRDYFDKEW